MQIMSSPLKNGIFLFLIAPLYYNFVIIINFREQSSYLVFYEFGFLWQQWVTKYSEETDTIILIFVKSNWFAWNNKDFGVW